jgi:exopolysaccharide biosynthesis polyprenyl glycosylphosphotransferase
MKQENGRITNMLTLLVDMISMLVAFYLAAFIRKGILGPDFLTGWYGNALIVLLLSCIIISYVSSKNDYIFKRGFFDEAVSIIKDQGKLCLILLGYIFVVQQGSFYSRFFFTIFFILNALITYVSRSYMKLIMLLAYKKSSSSNKVMLITLSDKAVNIIRKIRREYEWSIYVTSVALMDKDRVGEKIEGISVLANMDNLLDVVKLNVVDEVFIHLPHDYELELEEIILEFEKMGIVVHLNLDVYNNMNIKEKTVNEFAGHQVITFSTGIFDEREVIVKRILDILGGFIGVILTGVLTLFLAPAILIESRGPIFFSQTRIGKNGRKFKIYKFRSMYPDAEQRKKELMEKNEMTGLMFKMTDDPRITKVGKFIRRTSLDEFPQFINVFMGDMSLVGTRPPTMDEFEKYEGRHKRRLSLKPGLTGLWQVSGRSDIQDFEEVVKLDLEYIDNWSMGLDLKLLFKTVIVVVFGKGSK